MLEKLLRFVLLLCAVPMASALFASGLPVGFEREPNDSPGQATVFAGAAMISALIGPDDTDLFCWTLSDTAAAARWSIELEGLAGADVRGELLRANSAGLATERNELIVVQQFATGCGPRPAKVSGLLFDPGDYWLRVSAPGIACVQPYRAAFRRSDAPSVRKVPVAPDRREQGLAVRNRFETAIFAETHETWLVWSVMGDEAAFAWEVTAQAPVGRTVFLEIHGPADEQLGVATSSPLGIAAAALPQLAPGDYYIRAHADDGGYLLAVSAQTRGAQVTAEESEPNGEWAFANLISLPCALTGSAGPRADKDVFCFDISAETAACQWEFALSVGSGQTAQLSLISTGGELLQSRTGGERIVLPHVTLSPGRYAAVIDRMREGTTYTLETAARAGWTPGAEAEPNDDFEQATALPVSFEVRGHLFGADTDCYRLFINGPPQLWRIETHGSGVSAMRLINAAGQNTCEERPAFGAPAIRLDNVWLVPGPHWICVTGKDASYDIQATPLGPAPAGYEREPNDDLSRAHELRAGTTRQGLLATGSEKDLYRFFLAAEEHLLLTVAPGSEGEIRTKLFWDGQQQLEFISPGPGQAFAADLVLPPGDYQVELWARTASSEPYSLSLESLDPFTLALDQEPNNGPALANPVPVSGELTGIVGEFDNDEDWYVFAPDPSATAWTLTAEIPDGVNLAAFAAADIERNLLERDPQSHRVHGQFGSGQHYFEIKGRGGYRIPLTIDPAPASVRGPGPLDVELSLGFTQPVVAAFSQFGQRLTGVCAAVNVGTASVSLELAVRSNHFAWRPLLAGSAVSLAPGERRDVPLTVDIAADAWSDWPVRITAQARGASGGQVSAMAWLRAETSAPLAAPFQDWRLPAPLLGGLNAARLAFGAEVIAGDPKKTGRLFDGYTPLSEGLLVRLGSGIEQPAVRLAGDGPVPVAGFTLNPLSNAKAPEYPRQFSISLSVDGSEYQRVVSGTLQALPMEQVFLLEQPVSARFARLEIESAQQGGAGANVGLGEWKIIAQPGAALASSQRFNIADPAVGGHVAWSEPNISLKWDQDILTETVERPSALVPSGATAEWVVGFEQQRAAQITELVWVESEKSEPERRFSSITLSASLDSPVGPWVPLGAWNLDKQPGLTKLFTFEQPVWARYLRFAAPAQVGKKIRRHYPETVRVFERPTDAHYQSILAEWGHYQQDGPYERAYPPRAEGLDALTDAGHSSLTAAQVLELGQEVHGRVQLGVREEFYSIGIPEAHNVLALRLAGDPDVRVAAKLTASDGTAVPLRLLTESPREHLFEAQVVPGASYTVGVTDPLRSVVFCWDTSGSVAPYIPVTYSALNRFTEDVAPGLETVNFLPLGGGLLLEEWSDDPVALQIALASYDRSDRSSAAESALRRAAEALASRRGERAVVLITDAATTRDQWLWRALRDCRPRVFALALSSGGSMGPNVPLEQDLMQDWARVNRGHYDYLRTQGELDRGFARAAAWLRRPAGYGLTASTRFEQAPGPGALRIEAGGDTPIAAGSAVELILDASGSMLKPLDGRQRIELAKEVLIDVVTRQLPRGLPLALRVFGHIEPNACRSDLVLPLAPLEPEKTSELIRGITAQHLAKTPLADSLRLVSSDLAQTPGNRAVVLVTDGEETCGGDPAAAIQALQDQGVDLRINIVGFAIGDAELKTQFANWASAGGGRYFDASNAAGLNRSISEALRAPFTVFDASGGSAGQGTVGGEPVPLPAGEYRVEIGCDPPQRIDAVLIVGGQESLLTIGE